MIFLYVFIIAKQIEMRYIYRTKVLCELNGLAKQNKPTGNKQNENNGNRNIQYFFVNSQLFVKLIDIDVLLFDDLLVFGFQFGIVLDDPEVPVK